MAMFDLASVLKDAGAQMGTGEERIEYIDIDRIKPDPGNFYAMSGIEALCGNIELVGLQQPLRVRTDAEDAGSYIIVSGHRRWTALGKLVSEGKDQFKSVPCIVEQPAASADLQELRLIYANSDTRKLTPAELSRQAERVEELLYKLKEAGVEFPGRMRDHVAEACQTSKSKLGRLKQIKKGLAPDICAEWFDTSVLNEAAALALAQQPEDVQHAIIDRARNMRGGDLRFLGETLVKNLASDLARLEALACPVCSSEGCINQARLLDKLYSGGWRGYSHCADGCCRGCPEIATCTKSCQRMAGWKASAREMARAEKAKKDAAVNAKNEEVIAYIKELWRRMAAACAAAGVDYIDLVDDLDIAGVRFSAEDYLAGRNIDSIGAPTPFGYGGCSVAGIRTMISAADKLGVSIDYLLGREGDNG